MNNKERVGQGKSGNPSNSRLFSKRLILIILSVFIVSMVASGVEAAFTDVIAGTFGRGLDNLQNFVTGGFKQREQIFGFFLIFFILLSGIYAALANSKLFKEQKRAGAIVAFSISMISALAIVSTTARP